MSPLGRMVFPRAPPSGKHSIMLPPLAWHICIISHDALHTAALILSTSCRLVSDDATDILPHTILKTRVTNLPSAPPPPNPGIHFGLQWAQQVQSSFNGHPRKVLVRLASARISHFLTFASYTPKSILFDSCHLFFQIYTMFADFNVQIVFKCQNNF